MIRAIKPTSSINKENQSKKIENLKKNNTINLKPNISFE